MMKALCTRYHIPYRQEIVEDVIRCTESSLCESKVEWIPQGLEIRKKGGRWPERCV